MIEKYSIISYDKEKLINLSRFWFPKHITDDMIQYHYIHNWNSIENVAYDFYGSCDYFWIICALNNIVDPFDDWLHTDEEVKILAQKKYGGNLYGVHHYELDGIKYTSKESMPVSKSQYTIITNYDYELQLNEQKRMIKVLNPKYLEMVKSAIKQMII